MKLAWVVLTMGDRWPETLAALASLAENSPDDAILLVLNGCAVPADLDDDIKVVALPENVGIPAGRAAGFDALDESTELVGFLDDDAMLVTPHAGAQIKQLFASSPPTGAATLRIVDQHGVTARRHVPRVGQRGEDEAGDVATFLGGASIIRAAAYRAGGGYWGELFYSHEELDLAWRMIESGYTVRYAPAIKVQHPRTPIGRHADGWRRTGRNRVLIARRNLPLVLVAAHTGAWLVAGFVRAGTRDCRTSYLRGWASGWRAPVERNPISWGAVWRLTRLGRPPIL